MSGALNLIYVNTDSVGYGRYGLKLAEALERRGIKVLPSLEPGKPLAHVAAWVATPPHVRRWYTGQYTVLSTMWEGTVLPEAFRENLHDFDLVVVPSEHNAELFSKYHPNVKRVWLGVDTEQWKPVGRVVPTDRFVFLIGGSGKRKGTDLAYRAFKKVFKTWPAGHPTPYLVMKSPRSEDYYGERIERVGGRITTQAELDLYGLAHCYLQPSRGEGWGLQPLQAMATGMPTILTDGHGHHEFAHLGIPIKHGWAKSEYFIHGDAGDWWEPDFDELCERMWDVYSNYELHLERAKKSAGVVARVFSWDRCAARFIDAVGEERFQQPYDGNFVAKVPNPRLFLVRVQKPWAAWVANIFHQWVPGKDYYEIADVKRVLFDAEVLDSSCIIGSEEQMGLSAKQVAAMGDYSGRHSYCWTCGQKLGTGELQI